MKKYYESANLPKLPKELGPHEMDDMIYALRHMVAAYCVVRQQQGLSDNRLHQISCVNTAMKALGGSFHKIARSVDEPELAGVIYERGNRYYDMANEDQ